MLSGGSHCHPEFAYPGAECRVKPLNSCSLVPIQQGFLLCHSGVSIALSHGNVGCGVPAWPQGQQATRCLVMGMWGCGSPAQTQGWGTPAQPQDTGFLLRHGDMGVSLGHRNVGVPLSHMDVRFPLDYGEMGLCHGDLGLLLGHRDEAFLLSRGEVGFPLD